MPVSKNEERCTVCARFYFLYEWFWCWSIWWKRPLDSLASIWCYCITWSNGRSSECSWRRRKDILKKRVFSKELFLKTRITRNKRLNLATTPINNTKLCSNAMEMERNAFGVVIVSVEKNDLIALESVLLKRISEECLCLTLMVLWEKLQRVSCFGRFHTSALLIWTCIPNIWWSWCKDT